MFRRIFWPGLIAFTALVIWRLVRARSEASTAAMPHQWTPAPADDQSIDAIIAGASTSEHTALADPAAGADPPDLLAPTEPATPAGMSDDTDSAPVEPPGMLAATEPATPAEPVAPDMLAPPATAPIEDSREPTITPHIDEQTLDAPQTTAGPSEPLEAGAQPADAAGAGQDTLSLDVYCVRCREHRTLTNAHIEITSNGRRAARGVCPVCGANVFTFLPQSDDA
jgi:hypothetical protein